MYRYERLEFGMKEKDCLIGALTRLLRVGTFVCIAACDKNYCFNNSKVKKLSKEFKKDISAFVMCQIGMNAPT